MSAHDAALMNTLRHVLINCVDQLSADELMAGLVTPGAEYRIHWRLRQHLMKVGKNF